jgi:LPXTG-site transpeptidase (sortase) family protein
VKRPWYRSSSSWLAALFVASAGAVAWFGTGAGGHTAPTGDAQTMAGTPADAAAAVARLSTGGLPTRVVIGEAGIDAPISEVGIIANAGRPLWETAWHAVGHNLDSSLPGQPGNMVLTGHVSVADRNNAAYFAQLDSVAPGDEVDVYSGDQVFHYRISNVSVVDPSNVRVLRSGAGSTVTLITCTKDLKHRLVVVGTLA